ncbi:hypothetical protein [Roseibium sp. SCP14]|uniref:hypothetical protein n=1 Tax=Roseibium sp. SCP14 TaxID=3141375 RepID=UPI0033394ECB
MSVFGRDDTFDQQTDPIVRLEARRLRRDIDSYYAGPGRDEPIRISIPKGTYVPRFEEITDGSEAEPEKPAEKRSGLPSSVRRWQLALSVAAVAVCAVLIGVFALLPEYELIGSDNEDLPKGPVIAVLPFTPLGEGPDYVADGITQQLTTELVRFRDLWVLPLGSVARFRHGKSDLSELRSEFGADYVLEGSVSAAVGTLNITARLVDLETDRYIWVHSYDTVSSPKEIYEAQNLITREVIGNLAGKYGILAKEAMNEAARRPPETRSAYDCVLEYYSYQITINLERHGEVKTCVERAIALEPDYAEAWAVLSNLHLQQIRFALGGNRQELFAHAEEAARRAVELDPHSASAHLMQANVRFVAGDLEGFRKSGGKATSLNPNDNAILAHFALRLALSGSWQEGLAIMDRAIALNPVHPHWYHFPWVFYHYERQEYREALSTLDKIKMPDFFWTHLWRTVLNAELGNDASAQEALAELIAQQPELETDIHDMLSVWLLNENFKERLVLSLEKAGLKNKEISEESSL